MGSKDNGKVPLPGSRDLAGLKTQVALGILYRSIALAVFTAFLALYFPGSIFFMPLVVAAVILYIDSLCGLVLAGRMAKPLSYSLKALAATAFLAVLAMTQEEYPAIKGLELQVLLAGGLLSAHFLSRAYSDYTGAMTRALFIAAAGVLYYSLFSAQEVAILSQLTLVALIGLASAAAFSLLSLLRRHGNARISYIGNLFAKVESPAVVCTALAAIVTYVLFIRQSLMVFGFFGLTIIEWAALCLGILLLLIKIWSIMPVDGAQMFGEGKNVAESLRYDRGELKNATGKVEEFVVEGKKDGLVALMAAALTGNGVPVDRVQSVIAIIVDHEDEKEPPAMFKWAVGNINEANRKKRLKAVNEMIAAAVSAVEETRAPAVTRKAAGH